MALTGAQRQLVENNMGLVKKVIADCVRNPNSAGIFSYDDLVQIGNLGLCRAAESYVEGRRAKFDTYAYILIRNEIFNKLEYATLRSSREQLFDPDNPIGVTQTDSNVFDEMNELDELLSQAESESTGVISKGIAAIRLMAQGYSCKEIGVRFDGASANNVSAWISRARKHLMKDPMIASLMP